MQNVLIRPAIADDCPAVEAIMQQVQALHVSWRPDVYKPAAPAMPREEFDRHVAAQTLAVAENDGRVIGILSWMVRHIESERQVKRDVLFIDSIAVDEPFRGQGVGRALLDHARSMVRERGFDKLMLQVNARNAAAMKMYREYGFTETSINMEL